MTLAQENQCDEADQPTISIQPEESLSEKAMQDVEQQPGNEEAAMPSENENTNIFQNSVAAKGGEKKRMKVVEIFKFFGSLLVK